MCVFVCCVFTQAQNRTEHRHVSYEGTHVSAAKEKKMLL